MAKQTTVLLIDDIDGGKADTTVRFAWQGTSYEIDLSSKNARAFEAAINTYVSHATRTAGSRTARRTASKARTELSDIRSWASHNGHSLASRGRIPAAILDAYRAAQGGASVGATPARRVAKKAAKKTTARKAPARKAPARKVTARKAPARKAAARRGRLGR